MTWSREDGKVFETLSEDISTMNSGALHIKRKAMPVIRFMIIGYNPGSDMVFLRVNESVYSYGFEDRRLERVDECSAYCWDIWRFHSRTTSCVLAYKHSLGAIQIGKMEEQERKYRGRRQRDSSASSIKNETRRPPRLPFHISSAFFDRERDSSTFFILVCHSPSSSASSSSALLQSRSLDLPFSVVVGPSSVAIVGSALLRRRRPFFSRDRLRRTSSL
ncbi:hypothetical protein RHMOL_Rhmol10G0129700 [Rhododendron molle]|uniref:Uncharacterized protein n=1 Tax=Rhododendron molle TaxID=49168 RepID=A0ACC0M1X1_RHOML|nr:hypothetical protein RHMOL_Rhmol10G0129700 [Rhododendron molle]